MSFLLYISHSSNHGKRETRSEQITLSSGLSVGGGIGNVAVAGGRGVKRILLKTGEMIAYLYANWGAVG